MKDRRMSAYYYSFDKTGSEDVDRILSAIACAGKAFHSTADWVEDCDWPSEPELLGRCPVDWIQNAANSAARRLARYDEAIRLLRLREPGCSGNREFISSVDLNRLTAAFLAAEPKEGR